MSDLRLFPSLRSLTLTALSTVRSIDLGYDNKIERVCVSGSGVEYMDLSGCGGITEIECANASSLGRIVFPESMPFLSVLELENTAMEELSVINAPELESIGNIGTLKNIRSLSLDNVGIESLTLSGTSVETVAISRMPRLKDMDLSGNSGLTVVTITDAGALSTLSVASCSIPRIDLAGAPALVSLCCDHNPLRSLDISANKKIETLSAVGVPDANEAGKLTIYMAFDSDTPVIIPEDDERIVIKTKTEWR